MMDTTTVADRMPDRDLEPALSGAACDLDLLCRLHDREPDAALIAALSERPARDWFALATPAEEAEAGYRLLDSFLAEAAARPGAVDELAADFADLYLTFGKRLAPDESYWLTEDHLERQEPMFAVRGWYTHYGVAARDWRKRADDHLVHQIEFVAMLLRDGRDFALRDAGRFLDRHLLVWSKAFLGGVAARADTAFYAGLGLASEAHLQAIRRLIETVTGEARAVFDLPKERAAPSGRGEAPAISPELGPGW